MKKLITAFSPMTGERVNLYFDSIKEARARNPSLKNFREIKLVRNKKLSEY